MEGLLCIFDERPREIVRVVDVDYSLLRSGPIPGPGLVDSRLACCYKVVLISRENRFKLDEC